MFSRPIFPRLDLSVTGLDPEEMYSIAVRLVCVDKYRYQYKTSIDSWEQTYEDTLQPGHPRSFEHPQSPANGQTLNEKLLSFTELRFTNRATKADNMVSALFEFLNRSLESNSIYTEGICQP